MTALPLGYQINLSLELFAKILKNYLVKMNCPRRQDRGLVTLWALGKLWVSLPNIHHKIHHNFVHLTTTRYLNQLILIVDLICGRQQNPISFLLKQICELRRCGYTQKALKPWGSTRDRCAEIYNYLQIYMLRQVH